MRADRWRLAGFGGALVLAVYALLLIPDAAPPELVGPRDKPFVWDKDAFFRSLETEFKETRAHGCSEEGEGEARLVQAEFSALVARAEAPNSPAWDEWEASWLRLVARSGGCPSALGRILALKDFFHMQVKGFPAGWRDQKGARDRIYRIVYGSRLATEELLLQMPKEAVPELTLSSEEPSSTPSVVVRGVSIHSGDLLVSRGGAPTSAFIARGSDYPGNFSHVALVHVSHDTGEASIIESHIESGVGISTVEEYLEDKKLRLIVLRPSSELPLVQADPTLPHRAATFALKHAQNGHTPYDFTMDVNDPSRQFCSEVASSSYAEVGVHLWRAPSRFSSPGLGRWMAALGVRHLETYGPSDLEYDSQLRVVAEWHDPEELFYDHVDGAVIDALLERAEGGASFDYSHFLLPFVRVLKGYSWLKNQWGGIGPIPEGMSATVALRVRWLSALHQEAREEVERRSAQFEKEHGYRPPYFRLVAFAEEAVPPL